MSRYSFHIKAFLRRQGCQRMIARGRTWKTSFEPTLERRKVNRMKRRWVSRAEKSKNVQQWRSKADDEAVFHSYAPFRRKSFPEDMHDTFETFFDTRRCLKKRRLYSGTEFQGIVDVSGRKISLLLFLSIVLIEFSKNCHFFLFSSIRNEFFLSSPLIGEDW